MIADLNKEKMGNANPQKQEFVSPYLQSPHRGQTHAYFAYPRRLTCNVYTIITKES